MTQPELAARLLNVIEQDILPLTEKGVAAGNKVFGAAILRKSDLSLVLAETRDRYQHLSDSYQSGKNDNAIPLN